MFKRIMFLFWMLVALFVLIPILNIIIQDWVEEGGILDMTFNITTYNNTVFQTTGNYSTANETQLAHVTLTPLEKAVTQFYVPAFIIFFVVIILYVLSKGSGGGGAYG